MKLKVQPENLLEWIALKLNLAPTPMADTQVAFNAARAIMAGAELGIYETIGKSAKSTSEIATACNTNVHATEQLLNALVGLGYLKWSHGKYSLKSKYHKWLLKESEANIVAKLRFQMIEWNWIAMLEEYVRNGKTLDLHGTASETEWKLYQEGMRDLSVNAAKELAGKIPISRNATALLDIGGSHGLYSIELCKKYPSLKSTILELPGAIEAASAIAKRYNTTGRVNYVTGNALIDDIGEEKYDLVMINNVVHHFSAEQNNALAKKIARALKPGGIYIIGEFIKFEKPGEGGVIGSTMSLYFSITSASGNWSASEMMGWQKNAGLTPLKPIIARTLPGWKMLPARK